MDKAKIVILGCGRKGKEVKDFIERYDLFEVAAFTVNKKYMTEDTFEGLPVYPLEELDKTFNKNEIYTFAASSHFNYLNRVKRILYNELKERGYKVANLISPLATVKTKALGDGNWINDFAYIDEETEIGSNNVLCSYAYIAHYSHIGSHNFFGIRSLIAGGVHIKNQCFVGIGATVFNMVHIGEKCIVGAGTIVKKNLKDFCMCRVGEINNIEVYEYDSESIEKKLGPMDSFVRKDYVAVKRS